MTIIRNFFHHVTFHPTLIFFVFISIVTGTFVHLFIILSIVFIHELGHYIAAVYYKWRIKGITLWLFGGVLQTEEAYTRPIQEDIIVTIAGPIQHIVIYGLLFILSNFSMDSSTILQLYIFYNTLIFIFNLLPIYPLDGGKLLFYFISFHYPFQFAHKLTIINSICLLLLGVIYQLINSPSISVIILCLFLLIENLYEWRGRMYLFIRFLLNRMENSPTMKRQHYIVISKKRRLMDVFLRFRRPYENIVTIDETEDVVKEQQCLHLYFNEKRTTDTFAEILDEDRRLI